MSVLPTLGVLGSIFGFVATGLGIVFPVNGMLLYAGCSSAVCGLAVMFGGLWLCAKKKRKGWITVASHCIDRELREVMSAGEDGGWVWVWRIKCEYDYLGTKYTVTPTVGWASFGSKNEAVKYLGKRISSEGECRLRINPHVPFQAELFGCDIVDKLFFR